jgi:hypothetical protein
MKEGILKMANTEYMGKLIQGKSNVKLKGIIRGLSVPKEGFGFQNKTSKAGKPYRAIKFFVETSPDNKIVVEASGYIYDTVKAKNKNGEEKIVKWSDRLNQMSNGFKVADQMYDKTKKFSEDFKDGDSVTVIGSLEFSTYTNKQGEIVNGEKITIFNIYEEKEPIDFTSENFEEIATFYQDAVIRDFVEDNKNEKLHVYTYVVTSNKGNFQLANFTINTKTVDQQLLRNIKTLKFGASLRINGLVQNRIVKTKDDSNAGWGTSSAPSTGFYKALEITGVDGATVKPKAYKVEDFVETQEQKANAVFEGNISKIDTESKAKAEVVDNGMLPFEV